MWSVAVHGPGNEVAVDDLRSAQTFRGLSTAAPGDGRTPARRLAGEKTPQELTTASATSAEGDNAHRAATVDKLVAGAGFEPATFRL